MESIQQPEEHLISDYKIQRQIGKGSFGIIYSAKKNLIAQKKQIQQSQQSLSLTSLTIKCKQHNYQIEDFTHIHNFAIKVENLSIVKPMLDLQFNIMTELQKIMFNQYKSKQNVQLSQIMAHPYPFAIQYGQCDFYTYLAMDQLAYTLQNKLKNIEFKVSSASILNAMHRALGNIQKLHEIGYIHRDIKPGNFMIRVVKQKNESQTQRQYLILMDFGLCKRYLDKRNEHIPMKEGKMIIGTPIYCSRNVHKGYQASRRDDLQSWFYAFLHFFSKLPWQTQQILNEKNKEVQAQLIKKKKEYFKINQFVKDNNLDTCLIAIYSRISQLNYSQQPCYGDIQKLLADCIKKQGKQIEKYLFWEKQPEQSHIAQPLKQKPQINIKFFIKKNKQISKIQLNQINKINLFEKIVKKQEIVDSSKVQ